MNSVAAARGSIVAHCAAIRHNAGGQLSPAVQSAFEARLDAEFWRFWRGSNIDAFASPVQCAKGPPGLRDACIVGATFQRPLFVRLLCQNPAGSTQPAPHPIQSTSAAFASSDI